MSLMHVSSPHVHKPVSSVDQVMKQVLLATIPGVLVLTWAIKRAPHRPFQLLLQRLRPAGTR